MRKVRIGIDVGGTFTDAVAIDHDTYEIIAQEKMPTTHDAAEGVAEGIIRVLRGMMEKHGIAPEEVVFIAHGTTQATNALLEGDVAKVGVLGMGYGAEARLAANASRVTSIPLAPGKALRTVHEFVETGDAAATEAEIAAALERLRAAGAEVMVATEAYGVDDPQNEDVVARMVREMGMPATSGHEVSRLYGLRVRTRTAVVNGSLIPKMMETADMTERCVQRSGIGASLMVMRCDGGAMTTQEMRRRPILTMLSGLAAGVAGVLMYERLSYGIFLEAGGTSTDISVVKDGRVMVRYSEIGGHKMYLSSLDVRTLGVAGGSMIRVERGRITDVGPRSAHIAGLPYEVFSPVVTGVKGEGVAATAGARYPRLVLLSPCADDAPVYAAVEGADGRRVALTLAGAANLLGDVPEGDYADAGAAGREAAYAAWQVLGDAIGCTADEAAWQVLNLGAAKIWKIVSQLMKEYELSPAISCLVGGGGSAGVIVPYLGRKQAMQWRVAKNAPIISTIGVALAMVREVVERTVVNPTDQDIAAIRCDALEQVMRAGAAEGTVEIAIEIDKKANILRAVAMGASELRPDAAINSLPDPAALRQLAAQSMSLPVDAVTEVVCVGRWHLFEGTQRTRTFGIFTTERHPVRVLDREGVVRLQREGLGAVLTAPDNLEADLELLLEDTVAYGTLGGMLPGLFAFYGEKQLDLSGLGDRGQVLSVLRMELAGLPQDEALVLLATA